MNMISARTLDRTLLAKTALAALMLALGLALASPVWAQADSVVAQARAAGLVGEQADGYLGIVAGQTADADVRARVDQINIRRRAEYLARAARNNATVNEMAASTACLVFASRIREGERYRDENGTWRQNTAAAPVVAPSWCAS
jgi:uncharacterized protein YdbL (DUF1318 family)